MLTDLSVVDECFWDLFARTGATALAGVPHTFDLLAASGFEARTCRRCATSPRPAAGSSPTPCAAGAAPVATAGGTSS